MTLEMSAGIKCNVCVSACRCYLRRGHAIPVGVSLEEAAGAESFDPKRPVSDAAERRQRRGLHQLPRQRRL